MNREELIERGADAVRRGYPKVAAHVIAEMVVDAILPQVTTVEELEALPVGAVVISRLGRPYSHFHDGWSDRTGGFASSWDMVHVAPLTVVWLP